MNKSYFAGFVLSLLTSSLGCSSSPEKDVGASGGGSTGVAGATFTLGGAGASAGSPASGGVAGGAASGGDGASTSSAGTSGAGTSSGGVSGASPGGAGGGGGAGPGNQAGSGGGLVDDAASGSEGVPPLLSQAGLFEADMVTPANGVRPFKPQYQLWADNATKRRWLWLPPGTKIDTQEMDYWKFPVGTRVYKEFTRDGKRVETRRLEKRADESWSRVAYLWREDQSDADAVPLGVLNASGTEHDVPSAKTCGGCHLRMPDKILGFSAIQLAHDDEDQTGWTLSRLAAEGRLTVAPPASLVIPGDDTARAALGYMHANCGHCHNPRSSVTTRIEINLWLTADSLGDVRETPVYQTTVGERPLSEDTPPTGTLLIAPGDPENSVLLIRMKARGPTYSMPPLGTEQVDPTGRDAVEAWVRTLQPSN